MTRVARAAATSEAWARWTVALREVVGLGTGRFLVATLLGMTRSLRSSE
jgi:hypothetical protein